MSLEQLFFINGFTVNSKSISNYAPLTIASKQDRLKFTGVLTTPIKSVYRAGKKRTFKNQLISLQVTLTLYHVNPSDTSRTDIFTIDQQRAKITDNVSSKQPAIFEVDLNPFRNENVDFSTLKFGTYYLNVNVSIVFEVSPETDIVANPQVSPIFSNNLLVDFDTNQDVITDE